MCKYFSLQTFIYWSFFHYDTISSMLRLIKKLIYPLFVFTVSFSFFVEASSCESVFSKLWKKNPTVQKIFEALPLEFGRTHKIPKKAQVIHIPQMHYTPLPSLYPKEYVQFIKENTARTQLSVAKFMMTHKENTFVSEGVAIDMLSSDTLSLKYDDNRSSIDKEIIKQKVRSDFYKKDFEELTREETELLYMYGAPVVLLFLDHIKELHPYISKVDRDKSTIQKISKEIDRISSTINDKIDLLQESNVTEEQILRDEISSLDAKKYSMIMNQRESLIKDQVKVLRNKHPNKKVFFIFGAAHDFSYLFEKSSFYRVPNSVIIPKEYLSHPANALHYSRSTSEKINYAFHFRDGVLRKEIQDFKKDYKRAYDLLMNSLKNGDKFPVRAFSMEKEGYLTDEDIRNESKNIINAIHHLDEALLFLRTTSR